jgi:hypothetical protein
MRAQCSSVSSRPIATQSPSPSKQLPRWPFASGTANHHDPRGQKAREEAANCVNDGAGRRHAFHEILLHEEERLDRPDSAGFILED